MDKIVCVIHTTPETKQSKFCNKCLKEMADIKEQINDIVDNKILWRKKYHLLKKK